MRFTAVLSIIFGCASVGAAAQTSVKDLGGVGDGATMNTAAFARAIAACEKAGGGTVLVPAGQFLTGTIELKSHVSLYLEHGAVVLASQNSQEYPLVENVWTEGAQTIAPLIYAVDAQDIGICGPGTIDGQGESWWRPILEAKARRRTSGATTAPSNDLRPADGLTPRDRPQLVRFVRCKDVAIEGVTLLNSPAWNIHPLMCERVRIDGVKITAQVPSPNTDGINPESCRTVQISNCRIDVGDDGITLKSGKDADGRRIGKPDEDITITNCVVYNAHGGVSIGSEMSGGVRNVTVSNCVFHGTDNGIRIKSQRGRGGVVEGIAINNIVMQDVPQPFIVTTFYAGGDKPDDEYPVDEGTPRYRNLMFSNITARGAKTAGSITGLKEMPIENVTFSNVQIQAEHGFTCTSAKDVTFNDVVIDTDSGPALILKNCGTIESARLRTKSPHENTPLVQTASP